MVRRPRADIMQPRSTASDSATQRHRPKTLTVFAAAFAAGAVLAYGIDRVVDVHVVQVEPQVESEPIFVALRSLPQGAPITVWDVALKDWPKAMLPTTALKADASFEGMVLRHPVREGQPLLSVQLVRDGATLPTMNVATLPPAAAPVAAPRPADAAAPPAGPVEQFVPATPAEQSSATAVVEPEVRDAEVSRVEAGPAAVHAVAAPVAALQITAVADADIDADITTDVAAAESTTDSSAAPPDVSAAQAPPAVAAAETRPADAVTAAPADGPALVAIGRLFAAGTGATPPAEPTLAVTEPPATPAAVAPLAAPVPNLPTTDIERSLSAFSRRANQPETPTESVLDRTTTEPPPSRSTSTPRYHLVVPERIALAADSSFVQRPEPPSTTTTTPPADATPQQQATGTGSNSNVRSPGTTAATNPTMRPQGSAPGMRRPTMTPRQQAAKPAATRQATAKPGASKQAAASPGGRPAPKSAATPTPGKSSTPAGRGLGAWFPQFSGGSWQR